jgi:hypothetical protein
VYLLLKLNVGLDFARKRWRSIRFHHQHHRQQSIGSDDACVGFFSATHEVINPPSFGIGKRALGPQTISRTYACDDFAALRNPSFEMDDYIFRTLPHDAIASSGGAIPFRRTLQLP